MLPLLLRLLLSLLTPPALRVEATSKFPDRQQGVNACQLTTCCDFCCYCLPPLPLLPFLHTHTHRHTHSHTGGCQAELAQFSFSHSYLCSILLRAASFLCLFPQLFLVGLFPFALLSTCSFPSHVSRAHQLTHSHTHTLAQLQLQRAFNFSEFKAQKHKRKRAKPSDNKTNQSKTKAKKYEKRKEKNEQNVKRKAKFKRLHINQRDSPHSDFDSDAVWTFPQEKQLITKDLQATSSQSRLDVRDDDDGDDDAVEWPQATLINGNGNTGRCHAPNSNKRRLIWPLRIMLIR